MRFSPFLNAHNKVAVSQFVDRKKRENSSDSIEQQPVTERSISPVSIREAQR